ncbi:MAG: hypothetical protein IBX69_02785 [Anaerolineales bacterium]|nr:hypothetical protein [Anaerolineales bacterium]
MDYGKLMLVFLITIVLVVGVNGLIYVMLRRVNAIGEIELFRKAIKRAKKPWAQEDDALEELARRVEAFTVTNQGDMTEEIQHNGQQASKL